MLRPYDLYAADIARLLKCGRKYDQIQRCRRLRVCVRVCVGASMTASNGFIRFSNQNVYFKNVYGAYKIISLLHTLVSPFVPSRTH